MSKKRPLTEEEKAMAALIKATIGSRDDLTEEKVAIEVGVTQGMVSHWSGARLPVSSRRAPALAAALGIADPSAISVDFRKNVAGKGYPKPVSNRDATIRDIPRSDFRRVPVVGTASLGMDGFWTDLEYPAGHGDGYFEFPTRDPDAYVLQVKGGSMHPAIRSGWYVVIEPNKQIQMGEFVMVKLVDGRSTVKEFLWHRDGEYVLNAVANNERLILAEGDVEFVHHVGGILPPSGRQP